MRARHTKRYVVGATLIVVWGALNCAAETPEWRPKSFEEIRDAVLRNSEDPGILFQFANYARRAEHRLLVLGDLREKVNHSPNIKWVGAYYLALMNAGRYEEAADAASALRDRFVEDPSLSTDQGAIDFAEYLVCNLRAEAILSTDTDVDEKEMLARGQEMFQECIEASDKVPAEYVPPTILWDLGLTTHLHPAARSRALFAIWSLRQGFSEEGEKATTRALDTCARYHEAKVCDRVALEIASLRLLRD